MTALPSTLIPRVSRLVRMLASPVDGEALNAARALGNTLKSAGFDINDLAETLEQPRKPRAPRAARAQSAPPRAPQGSGMVWSLDKRITIARMLRTGISGGLLNAWEVTFATDIIAAIMSPSRPRDLTPKQTQRVNELLIKIAGFAR